MIGRLLLAATVAVLSPDDSPRPRAGHRVTRDYPRDFDARIVAVLAGDRVRVLDQDDRIHDVRLMGVASPADGQQWHSECRNALAGLLTIESSYGRPLKVYGQHSDSDGTLVGQVEFLVATGWGTDGTGEYWVNEWVVSHGWGFWDYRWSRNVDLAIAERHAWENRLGMWQDDRPNQPWGDLASGK